MHEQLAEAARLVIQHVRMAIFGNIAADQPELAVLDPAVGLGQRYLAVAQTLHLAANQHDTALDRIKHRVIVPRLAILRDRPLILARLLGGGAIFLVLLGRGWGLLRDRVLLTQDIV